MWPITQRGILYLFIYFFAPGNFILLVLVAFTCIFNAWGLSQEDQEFEAMELSGSTK